MLRRIKLASAEMRGIYRDSGIQSLACLAYAPGVERYDWPLLAVLFLVALSISLVLRALRTAIRLVTGMRLKLGAWRQIRVRESRMHWFQSVFRYGRGV